MLAMVAFDNVGETLTRTLPCSFDFCMHLQTLAWHSFVSCSWVSPNERHDQSSRAGPWWSERFRAPQVWYPTTGPYIYGVGAPNPQTTDRSGCNVASASVRSPS